MNNEWKRTEQALYRRGKAQRTERLSPDPVLAQQLLDMSRKIFERAHTKSAKKHRKSSEIVKLLRLMGSPHVYAPGTLFEKRLFLLSHILKNSNQRPVIEMAALILLTLEQSDQWCSKPALKKQLTKALEEVTDTVLPVGVLLNMVSSKKQPTIYTQLQTLSFREKKTRLGELVGILNTCSDEPDVLVPIVDQTFEAIFDNTSPVQKEQLIHYLFKTINERNALHKTQAWSLLIDPLVLQNADSVMVMESLLGIMNRANPEACQPYLVFYTEALDITLWSDDFFKLAAQKGSRILIPNVYPATQHTNFLGMKTSFASRAQKVVDEIFLRENIDETMMGQLSVTSDAHGGHLSLVRASHGALSLKTGAMLKHNGPIKRSPLQRLWRWLRNLFA